MEYSQHSSSVSTSEAGELAERFRRIIDPSWKGASPVKRMSSSGRHLFSPIDSDQELNDLEVENAFVDGGSESNTDKSSPSKSAGYATPGKSAMSPFRPSTVMTNLQRGNVQTTTPSIIEHMSIHQMAAQGELVILQQDIMEGNDVNKNDEQGLTALHWACANGQMSTVEFLIQSKADINLNGNNGENALLLASCYGYREIVKLLLQHGMDVNYVDESGSTALMYASFNNHAACVKTLLEFGADLTVYNEDHMTAFDLAVGQDNKTAQHAIERHMLSMFEGFT
ncbi:ankyrin repeat family A protein 2-like [Gigantopelta aegis]|uniref:ankyrin repeat family A protein 2-like n=1 Tax=Gigantopelta aegis TaxID=1735272 RepID=UPI001B88C3EC|nr:ankyrin repeat family A protein 2-like [Gigantopelta aegis]